MPGKNYSFDEVIERHNTGSLKWDRLEERFGSGDLLPLWVADMDFRAPPEVIDALSARVRHGIYGYSALPASYYDSLIDWYRRRYNWRLRKEWIVFTQGVVPAVKFAVRAFTRPGDRIIVQPPVYYPFFSSIESNGRHILNNQLKLQDGHYEMDFEDLEEKARDPRTKMIILCSPHNPVGRVWSPEELQKLGEICIDNGVLVVSDEIHSDLVYPGIRFTNFASISDRFAENSVTCTSVTKTFNLAGLQASNIIIPNEGLRQDFENAAMSSAGSMPNAFVADAVQAAYNRSEDWLEELRGYLAENLAYLRDFVKERMSGVRTIEPEGTYLVWLDFRETEPDPKKLEDLVRNRAKVALDEGYIFGDGGEGFERINIACPRSLLKTALERISEAVAHHNKG